MRYNRTRYHAPARTARLRWAIGVLVLAGIATTVRAGDVQLLVGAREVYVDVPFPVAIDVTANDAHKPPEFPKLENADVSAAEPQTSSSTSISIINGRRTQSQQTKTRYLYRITPKETGTLRIPPIAVEVDGQTMMTAPAEFHVSKSETGDLLLIDLVASKDSVYIGEPLTVTLEVSLAAYNDGRISLDAEDMWQTIDQNTTDWGIFNDLITARPPQVKVRRDNRRGADGAFRPYFVYELEKQVYPDRAGALDVGDVKVVVQYPLQVTRPRSMFSMFDGPRVSQSRPIAARVGDTHVTVRPLPKEGQPDWFTGAVGRYSIKAEAKPRQLRVGDPITLVMTIEGNGRMDLLRAPQLARLSQFSGKFQVADDQLPGVVENNEKRFTQSIRATSADVTEIPAISFAYFDPDQQKYVTVQSDPIPIKVTGADRMAVTQIVESGKESTGARRSLTELQRGIEANYTDPDALLAAQGIDPGPVTVGLAAASPILFLLCLLVRNRRRKLSSNVALLRRRAARRSAWHRLDEARAAQTPAEAAGHTATALLGYVADRLDVPAGGLTGADAASGLRRAGAPDDRVTEVESLVAECEAAQFAGAADLSTDGLVDRARQCIDGLERVRF